MQVVVFTGGGTVGHVAPGIAVAVALVQRAPARLVWIGSKDGIERRFVEALGWEYRAVPTGKLRRYLSWKNVTDLVRIAAGYFASRKVLKELQPAFVFSKGGFVSVPAVWAAKGLHLPVYSHESDLDPGLATRLNQSASRLIFVAYEKTRQSFSAGLRDRVVVSGNPVRAEFFATAEPGLSQLFAVPAGVPVLVVLGGSQGALQVNSLVQKVLPLLEGRVYVIHQTGENWQPLPDTPWYASRPFFRTEMPALMQGASLVFGRSGAGTLWEAAACLVPLILLPLAEGSRGDQVRNAEHFAACGAAVVLAAEATAEDLAHAVFAALEPARRGQMQRALKAFGAREAATLIVEALGASGSLHV
ncbi:MAG: UDP-N-acetylglucosamine--N-acetylmuramyl-(pentapeptide) pyrophosphoryl-undecaprenol N-acetylglucosamine transferase [Spirochaetales bacterium]